MKTLTTMILTVLMSSLLFADNFDMNTDIETSFGSTTMGNNALLQIGEYAGENDGVEFSFESKGNGKGKNAARKGTSISVDIYVVNTTGKKAYLTGWFDFNNDGQVDKHELLISKNINSSKNAKLKKISQKVNLPKDELLDVTSFSAYFELTDDAGQLGTMSEGQDAHESRKINDAMIYDASNLNIRANNSDEEVYDIPLIDEDPVSVTLSSFEARETVDGIVLEWKVENEINHAGYNVYRSSNENNGFEKINTSIILGWDGFTEFDGTYEYIDAVQGSYFYKLQAVEVDGSTEMFGPYSVMSTTGVQDKLDMPESFELQQNYPNPFNPTTTINFSLAERTSVILSIFDVSGRLVSTLVNGELEAGSHSVSWTAVDSYGASLATGVYFYIMSTENLTLTKSMTIVK